MVVSVKPIRCFAQSSITLSDSPSRRLQVPDIFLWARINLSDSVRIAESGFLVENIFEIDPTEYRYADEMKAIVNEFLQKVK